MSQYRTLFLIADPAMRRTPAFDEAARLAEKTGARLHACIFAYDHALATANLFSPTAAAPARSDYLQRLQGWLDIEADALRARGVQVTTAAVWAHPRQEEMLAQIGELAPDLVLKDVHHEPLLKRVLMTPLDWRLLRLCPAPLLLVSGNTRRAPRRIVAAVDPTRLGLELDQDAFNDDIIKAAQGLALQCDAELHLAFAFQPLPQEYAAADFQALIPRDLYDTMEQTQRERFEGFADRYGVPAERRHFLGGPPGEALARLAAQSGIDVIVLGSVHRTGVERLMMGSTAEVILDRVPCSVLAIKPGGFAAEVRRQPSA
jgi:universal stress protein E